MCIIYIYVTYHLLFVNHRKPSNPAPFTPDGSKEDPVTLGLSFMISSSVCSVSVLFFIADDT